MAKEANKRVNIWLNQQGVENNLKSIRSAITQTANELNKLPIGSEEWYKKSEKLARLKSIFADAKKEIGATSKELASASEKSRNFMMAAGGVATVLQTASSALRRFVASTQEYVDAYANIDELMQAVVKSSGLARDEIEQLRKSFTDFNTKTSTEDLLKIAEIGGHLGLTKDQLRDFVQYTDQAMQTIGLSAEEVANGFSKIQRQFADVANMDIGETIQRAGSAMNALDSVTTSTESNILAFTEAVGKLPGSIKPSLAATMALGAAFESATVDAQTAAAGYAKILTTASANVEKFAEAMGKPVDEIRNLINTAPAQFLVELGDALRSLPADEQGEKLKELHLQSVRLATTIGALTNNTDEFRAALSNSTAQFESATAMQEDYNALNSTSAAQLEKAKKAVEDAKAALGEELIPVITELTKSTASSLKVLTSVVKFWTQHKALLLSLAGAYGALKLAQQAVIASQEKEKALTLANTVAGKAYTLVTKLLAVAKAKLAADTKAAAIAQLELKAAFAATPWGAIITAVAAGATGLGMLISKQNDARKSSEKFNVECAKEQAEAERLFEKLKKAEKGTTEYQEALDALKEKYPEIIQKHIDEEGALRDVEQAYKDVITQIQAKVAAQIKEEELTKATEKGIKDQVKALRGFNEAQKATIRQMTEEGKSVEAIGSALGISYFFTDFQGRQVKDDRFQALKDYVTAYETMKKDVVAIDKKYDPYLQQSPTSTVTTGGGNSGSGGKDGGGSGGKDGGGSGGKDGGGSGGNDPDKKLQTKIANFEKKLAEFRAHQQRETLEGWEKTKQTVIDSYGEMIEEATRLYGQNSAKVKELEAERDQAVVEAGQLYMADRAKTLENFAQKLQQWAKESMPDSGNEMLDAVLGTHEKWKERMNEAVTQLNELLELRDSMLEEGADTTSLDALINKVELSLDDINGMQAQDLQKVLQKYQQQTDNFIKEEQRSLTDATLTEKERQKAAIEEKYRLEIEYIEKTIAARIAAYGEDDPEVKQLREKIKLLNKLKGQQLENVGKSSTQKTIWQQLAEFDWSKMSDNWQDGLSLMTQGLQDFAQAAFDIYGSIAQIQDNMMQAELQKTQEAYDAKSAALKRQLDQGVISQKAYDAKMEQLTEEKEKKEKKLKHDQFAREQAANIVQALINGALAITNIWAQWGGQPIVAAVLTAVAAATNAVQIAAIASQPNPYYKGGYIRGKQYAVMGEAGDEWVASNKLLRDRQAADIISALDEYQRGNSAALAAITVPAPDLKSVSQSVPRAGGNFAASNQTTNNYYQSTGNDEQLQELRKLNDYLSDPMNRRSYISRRMQLEFEEQELEVREMARL